MACSFPRLLCAFLLAAGAGARAGTIVGTVRAQPPAPAAGEPAGGGNYQSHRYKFVEKIDYRELRDFVVSVAEAPRPASAVPRTVAVTTQKDASFDPHVLPVCVGTTVRWPNEDDIFHNVYSSSEIKPFDLDYYKRERVPEVVFDRVGRVDVFCAIHTKMHCIILVLPNPYFALADEHGKFVIRDVPPGTYQLQAWHERLPGTTRAVVVPPEGEVRVDFVLGVRELPKY